MAAGSRSEMAAGSRTDRSEMAAGCRTDGIGLGGRARRDALDAVVLDESDVAPFTGRLWRVIKVTY
ncbi:hypothetical protein GCM10022226_68070 [Sphaerisporangium flaviroseum]|uniref:Uncharacterized protein n=1 Tax=Sphaerisporangium flaviroseum TaxID=509199 RepID=A0ABP7J7W7_9ACTN